MQNYRKPLEAGLYVAVRKCADRGEWLDTDGSSCSLQEAQKSAADIDKQMPTFAKDNPVVRFVEAAVVERVDNVLCGR